MLRRLVRALAVVAIAVAPAIVVPGASQAAPARYPVWPSFLSTGCNTVSGGSNGTTISCGTGAFLLTQVNSGYQCSQVDININSFSSGPFTVTATSQDGTQQNTVSINDNGDYYMRFPSFLVNNLLVIQMSAPDSGAMNVGFIATSPCPVVPTSTPVPPTNTPNPSDTATNTATAGPSHTPTTIPTNTPLPSGHNTFTPSATLSPTPVPATSSPTTTPIPSIDCGVGISAPDCNNATGAVWVADASQCPNDTTVGADYHYYFCDTTGRAMYYPITMPANGSLSWVSGCVSGSGSGAVGQMINPAGSVVASYSDPNGTCAMHTLGAVSVNGSETWHLRVASNAGYSGLTSSITFVLGAGLPTLTTTPTPSPTSAPTTPPLTATARAQSTLTAIALSYTPTPIPIPGQQETAIPTDTECPGGCAVAKLTAVPGLGTVTTVDTSPFSPLAHLSLSRSSCQPFGYAQIPVPVIHGTPALGSTTPLSVTWTVPVTGAWTNYNSDGTLNISNTAIQPCAMSEIPTFVWDLTYWLSVLMCAVAWFLWLIGFVGRLSGEETING